MLSRRKLIQLTGIGCGAFLGGSLHSALAYLNDGARENMINAIPGPVGKKIKRAQHIGYHVTSQPKASETFILLQEMWDKVFTRSEGWLQIIVLPDSAELPAADTEAVLATASGRFDAITVAGPAIDAIMPEVIPMQALAFAYKDSQAAKSVVNTPLYAECMREAALKNNLHCLNGLLNAGMRQMTTIKGHPLKTIKDFNGLVLRIPPSPIYIEQLQPLGIKPVMTPISDASQMMKKTIVMGQENPTSYAVMFEFYKVCTYLNETNHFWSGFNTLINADTWSQWPKAIKSIVQEEYTTTLEKQWPTIESNNAKATEFLTNTGMIYIQTDLTGVKEKVKPAQLQLLKRVDPRLQPIAEQLIEKRD